MYGRQWGGLLVRFWVTHRILSGFLTIGWYPILLGREVNKVYCPKIYQNDWRPFPETGPLVLCVPHRPSGYAVSHLFKGEKVNSGTFPCCSENFDPWKLCCCWNLPLYKCLAFFFVTLKVDTPLPPVTSEELLWKTSWDMRWPYHLLTLFIWGSAASSKYLILDVKLQLDY